MTIFNRSLPWGDRVPGVRRVALLVLLCAAGQVQAITLKIATISPEGSSWMQALRAAGKAVTEQTEGRVKFKFYPGGVMGDDKAVLRKMRVGSLQGGVMTVGILAQAYPDIQLYGLPLVFEDEAQLDYVRSRMDGYLLEGLEEAGYVGFGIAEIGFAYMMSQAEIRSVAFEITPIPLTIGDVLGGLQTSLVDTIAAPPVGALTLQWHTRLNYLLDVPVLYTYGLLVVGERYFNKLSQGDQQIVREVMAKATAEVNERSRVDHAAALEVLKQQGLEFLEPRAESMATFRAMADEANQRFVEEGLVTQPAWDLFQQYKAETP